MIHCASQIGTIFFMTHIELYFPLSYLQLAVFRSNSFCVFMVIHIVPPRVMMHGPSTAHNGTEVLLTCSVLEGRPSPDVRIVTPSNMAVSQHEIMFVATPNETGNYLCVANISSVTATASHYLYVYGMFLLTIIIYQQAFECEVCFCVLVCTIQISVSVSLSMIRSHKDLYPMIDNDNIYLL